MKLKCFLLALMFIFVGKVNAENCINFEVTIAKITKIHLKGELSKAVELSKNALQCSNVSLEDQVEIHLMLATIYDRIGLHNYSRPHPKNLAQIKIASSLTNNHGIKSQAKINLAYAEYYYRAEMPERLFPKAESFALDALKGFKIAKDLYGESDADHTLGLIYLQRSDFAQSRNYFDLSLKVENMSAAPRPRILADYQRHIGFIHFKLDEMEKALPYFFRSFNIRRDSGIEDAALFAAHSLASVLVNLGRTKEAYKAINYAIAMAEKLNSSYGTMISLSAMGKIHEQSKELEFAKESYIASLEVAKNIGHQYIIKKSNADIGRVTKLMLGHKE